MLFNRTKRASPRFDHMGRRPGIPGVLRDGACSAPTAFLGRLPEALLHVRDRLALRTLSTRAGWVMRAARVLARYFIATPCPRKIAAGRSASP